MSLNAKTPTLETKEMKTQTELFIVIDEMTNTLKHFGKQLEQKNEDSSNRISQLEACLMAIVDEFDFYIHQGILTYTEKKEIGMLKSNIENTKRQKQQTKTRYVGEKNINKTSEGNIKQRKFQTNMPNRELATTKTSILTYIP